jgi:polar amino acid transport system permease protein
VILASLLALFFCCCASPVDGRHGVVSGWVSLFRNTPLLVQLLFWYFAAWNGLPQAFRDW